LILDSGQPVGGEQITIIKNLAAANPDWPSKLTFPDLLDQLEKLRHRPWIRLVQPRESQAPQVPATDRHLARGIQPIGWLIDVAEIERAVLTEGCSGAKLTVHHLILIQGVNDRSRARGVAGTAGSLF